MKHVVMFSGGLGSWAAAKRVAQAIAPEKPILFFTDTLIEDEDLYRFLDEAAANVGGELVRVAEGRTPWQVFFDERMLGNSRIDPCSKVLKRQVSHRWLRDNFDPNTTRIYVGIDWSESHRYERLRDRHAAQGWQYFAPLCEAPYITRTDVIAWAKREGLTPPRLYGMGFSHNNCGGFCVKAGKGHFARLLKQMPERYREHEAEEQRFRAFIGRDVSILTDVVQETKTPLTLEAFRERIEAGKQVDMFDIGGCGCFVDDDEAEKVPA